MKIACIVVAYNPDVTSLLSNIYSYVQFVGKLYVVNNSTYCISVHFSNFDTVVVIENKQNLGIATALNIGCKLAIEDEFDFVLTMDQDSYFSPEMAKAFFENTKKLFENFHDLAIAVPRFRAKEIYNEIVSEDFIYLNNVITSGNILKLSAYTKIENGFEEKLFIDGVDLDFCFKLRLKKFKIAELTTIYLTHQLGRALVKRQLFPRKNEEYTIHLHEPIRLYYTTRNNLYLIKKYSKKFPKDTNHIFITLLHKIKNNLMHNDKKIAGLKMAFKGVYHFIIGRYGKL